MPPSLVICYGSPRRQGILFCFISLCTGLKSVAGFSLHGGVDYSSILIPQNESTLDFFSWEGFVPFWTLVHLDFFAFSTP